MLKLSIEKAILVSERDYSDFGWARYRIDFENTIPHERYVLGWISPLYPTVEFHDRLYDMKDWGKGFVREILQEDVNDVQAFKVRLYLEGIKFNEKDPPLTLLEEKVYAS